LAPSSQPQQVETSVVSVLHARVSSEVHAMSRNDLALAPPRPVEPTATDPVDSAGDTRVTEPSPLAHDTRTLTQNSSPNPLSGMDQVSAESRSVRVTPRQESTPVMLPDRRASAATPELPREAVEPRSIHVRIGRVEIRSTQPASPKIAVSRRDAGFSDFKLTRAYLDRSR